MPHILETIVTTRNDDGSINIAPQGPIVLSPKERYLFRPFQDSRTFENLSRERAGVLHITDDILLLVQSALGTPDPMPTLRAATNVDGAIIASACRYEEFVIEQIDMREQRSEMLARVVGHGTLRDFTGWNRASHAILEATILATRLHLHSTEFVASELARYQVVVEKTADERAWRAWELLRKHFTKKQ